MDILGRYYGKENFSLYGLFMRVPGTNAFYRRVFVTFGIFVLSFSLVFQVLKFVVEGFTLKLIVVLVPTLTAAVGGLFYLLYVTFNDGQQLGRIFEMMQDDLMEERSEQEHEIQQQYAMSSRYITKLFTGMLIITICGVPFVGFIPRFLDILMSSNNSRKVQLLYRGEIFIDQQRYFYYIYFLESCSCVIVGVVVFISENVSVIIGQHACGMSAVIGYQLETITGMQKHKTSKDSGYRVSVMKRLQRSIKQHQKLLHFAVLGAEFYDVPLTVILATSFCALTTSLVQVTDPELINMVIVIYTLAQFVQFFLVSCMGQYEIDASLRISTYAYNAKWYDCPPNARRMLQLIMLRSSKPCLIMARGIYVLSIENFMSVIQTVMSFHMVFRQAS